MRFKEIMEVAVRRDDPEMVDYDSERGEKEQDMRDSPYYVSWHAQSWEWYGDDDPSSGKGRYKPKGDGGRIVAININSYEKAQEIANKLDAAYEAGEFEDKNVYGRRGDSGYTLDYQGSNIGSMAKMDDFDRETIATVHPRWKPADYSGIK